MACTKSKKYDKTSVINNGITIENAIFRPSSNKIKAIPGTPKQEIYWTAVDKFSSAIGMGKFSCLSSTSSCPSRSLLTNSLAHQQLALEISTDYYVAQTGHCSKEKSKESACNTAGFLKLEALGQAMSTKDFFG